MIILLPTDYIITTEEDEEVYFGRVNFTNVFHARRYPFVFVHVI